MEIFTDIRPGFDQWWEYHLKGMPLVKQLKATAHAAWVEAQRFQAETKAINAANEWFAKHGITPDADYDGISIGLKEKPGPIQELQSTEEFMALIKEQNKVIADMQTSVDRLSKAVGWPGPADPNNNLGSQPNGEFVF